MIHLSSITTKSRIKKDAPFPFTVPAIKTFKKVEFHSPVTFLVGENGSGKSTFLEAVAAGANSVVVGGEDIRRDKTLAHARALAASLKFAWQKRTHRGFFLRAEDFFNFTKKINSTMDALKDMADEYKHTMRGYGLRLAQGSAMGQRKELARKYGENADARSHGESFLNLFQSRFVPGGLYLLDEPEAPLSPQRQLALLFMLNDMVRQDAQFIIATHSPIIIAFPRAEVLSFDTTPIKEIPYTELDHVTLTKNFLNNPESYLRHL